MKHQALEMRALSGTAGFERRRAARASGLGKMSFSVAVLAREGRGGSEFIPFGFALVLKLVAVKGSNSAV
jgi:hypothetical protein